MIISLNNIKVILNLNPKKILNRVVDLQIIYLEVKRKLMVIE